MASVLAAAAMLLVPSVPAGASGPGDFANRVVAAHNAERDRLGLLPLAWSGELAEQARHWAEAMAASGQLRHASQHQRRSAGENLWMGPAGDFEAEDMVASFISEKRHFRPGRFPDVSATGRWEDVGHYTQVIWADTREVGCARVTGGRYEFLVCRYWPGGNWLGQRVG